MLTQLGELLRDIRKDNDELLYDMAKKLEVGSAYLSELEQGQTFLTSELYVKITRFYKLTDETKHKLSDFIGRTFDISKPENIEAAEVSLCYSNSVNDYTYRIKIDNINYDLEIPIPEASSPYLRNVKIKFIHTKEYQNIQLKQKLKELRNQYSDEDINQILEEWKSL